MAAADNENLYSPVIVWNGAVSTLGTPLSEGNFTEMEAGGSTLAARLNTAIGSDGGHVSAQWILEGDASGLPSGSLFFLIEKATGSVVGAGSLGKGNPAIATLREGDWGVLKKHCQTVSGLVLLIVSGK